MDDAEQEYEHKTKKPLILLGPDEKRVNDEAIAALAKHSDVYQRGKELVRVSLEDKDGLSVPCIETLPSATLRELLTEVVNFDSGRSLTHPPDWCVSGILNRSRWDGVRLLRQVVEYPVLRPDGSVLLTPGYDPKTQLVLQPSGKLLPVPDQPTDAQLRDALGRLLDVVCDFPFAQDYHRSAWLAGLLTLFARHAYRGPTPFFLVDGNVRGAGKGLLCNVAAIIATGRRMETGTHVTEEAEERKRIGAAAMAGTPLYLIDNINSRFGSGAFDAALTATTFTDRVLGVQKLLSYPMCTVWWGNGNNVQFRTHVDTARRTLHIRLLSPEQNPEARNDLKRPRLVEYVQEQRAQLAADALTLLRGYHRARPAVPLAPWGSFEGWSDAVRAPIVWLGLPDPHLAHEHLAQAADTTASALRELVHGWAQMCTDQNMPDGCSARHAVEWLAEDWEYKARSPGAQLRFRRLHDALAELCNTNGRALPDVKQLGYTLRAYRGRVVDGLYLDGAERDEKGLLWKVFNRKKA